MNPSPKLQALNNAKLLLEGFMARNEPSFLGDAIDRVAIAYGIPDHVLFFLCDTYLAKMRAYDGEDCSYPMVAALQWLEALRKSEGA